MLTETSDYDKLYRDFRWEVRRNSTSRPPPATATPTDRDNWR